MLLLWAVLLQWNTTLWDLRDSFVLRKPFAELCLEKGRAHYMEDMVFPKQGAEEKDEPLGVQGGLSFDQTDLLNFHPHSHSLSLSLSVFSQALVKSSKRSYLELEERRLMSPKKFPLAIHFWLGVVEKDFDRLFSKARIPLWPCAHCGGRDLWTTSAISFGWE